MKQLPAEYDPEFLKDKLHNCALWNYTINGIFHWQKEYGLSDEHTYLIMLVETLKQNQDILKTSQKSMLNKDIPFGL